MSQPLVTIGVPAFKSQYLERCLRGALAQTYCAIDVVVVDDCSPDPIEAVVKRVSSGRIRYYRNADNVGRERPVRNWNRCLSLARGDWFCLLCDDDLYLPTFIEQAIAAAQREPSVDLVRAGIRVINADGAVTNEVVATRHHEDWLTFLWERVCNSRLLFASENLIRTAALRRLGGYVDLPAAWCSDDATLLALSHRGGVANVQEPLVCWRKSNVNITTTATVRSKLAAIEKYGQWLDGRMSSWADNDPRIRARPEWAQVLASLQGRWSDLRVDAMAGSWVAWGDVALGTSRSRGYPPPTVAESLRSAARLLKRAACARTGLDGKCRLTNAWPERTGTGQGKST